MATLTVYPDAAEGGTTISGMSAREGVNEDWGTIRSSAGNAHYTSSFENFMRINASSTTNKWSRLIRASFLFDTSGLGAGATITAAVMSLYGGGKEDGLSISPDVDVYTCNPTLDNYISNTDFVTFGTTSQTGSPIAYADWANGSYNDFTLDATGRGNVSKTGISKFGTRNGNYDVSGTTPPSWTINEQASMQCYFANYSGTARDPKLVITGTGFTAVGPANLKSLNTNPLANIKSINGNLIANVKSLNTNV